MRPPLPPFRQLTRTQFRDSVFGRDKHTCVMCSLPAKDAHHILERRLWDEGGYYLENGASVCEEHHLAAEATTVSCEELRERIGITKFPIPPHLYPDQPYDKWGNPIMPNGLRLKGELFDDLSVQKVLAPVLHLFTDRVKYPRTYHLPWSPGVTKDDRMQDPQDHAVLEQADEIVVTTKMDGENTTMGFGYVHARSLEYDAHPSRNLVKQLHAQIAFDIPPGFRVCGENLFAKHSIHYQSLAAHFQVFSIWDGNRCLSWDDTLAYAELLGLSTVPVVYRGPYAGAYSAMRPGLVAADGEPCEGVVVRVAGEFHYRQFRSHAAKFVRANHVQTHGHWMRAQVVPNGLR